MSTWNDIKKSVGLFAERTAAKTRELTDTASLKIKIASHEADRDTEYKKLGRLTYQKLKNAEEKKSEQLTLEISKVIEKLDEINARIDELRAEEQERREAKEAEKARQAADKATAESNQEKDE